MIASVEPTPANSLMFTFLFKACAGGFTMQDAKGRNRLNEKRFTIVVWRILA
jgi:hypothetical protein